MSLNLVVCVAASITALWKISQLVRAPTDRGLQVVTVCTFFVAAALGAQYFLGELASHTMAAAPAKLVQNVLLVWFFCALICYLQSALRPDGLFRWGWTEVGLAAAVSAALAAAYLASARSSPWSYTSGPASPPLLIFFLVGNVYMGYACVRGANLAWTARSSVRPAVSNSLRIAAAGLMINAIFVHLVRTVSTSSRLAFDGSVVPTLVDDLSQVALTLGIVVFSLGVLYPGARTVVIKSRLWLRDRQRYLALHPLWTRLVRGFPAIALDRPRGRLKEQFTLTRMRMRYYRRLIECRDGLLQVSPYMEEPDTTEDRPYSIAEQAAMVLDALERRNRGELPHGGAVAVAAPATVDMEDDALQLLRLSRAIEQREGSRFEAQAEKVGGRAREIN